MISDVLYILQTSMHGWYFEYMRPKIQSLRAHTNRVSQKCDIGVAECTSVHGIGIVVLNKSMKCVTETQSLLASTPCSHKSHMIALVTVHDFNFQLSMPSLTICEASWRWQHMQLLHVSAIRNTRATIVTQSQQWKINETLNDGIAWIVALRAGDYEFIRQSPLVV